MRTVLGVVVNERVFFSDVAGQLSFITTVVEEHAVGNGSERRLRGGGSLFVPSGGEEPKAVPDDAAAKGAFVNAVDFVRVRLFGCAAAGLMEFGQGNPLVVG